MDLYSVNYYHSYFLSLGGTKSGDCAANFFNLSTNMICLFCLDHGGCSKALEQSKVTVAISIVDVEFIL